MLYTRFSIPILSVPILLAAGVLAGCGGGSGAGGTTTALADVDNHSVFAAPSGPLCADKQDDICMEPTSSAATPQQLSATMLDPSGPEVRLSRYGHLITVHSKVVSGTESGAGLTESAIGYDSMEKPMILGRNRIKVDGKAYTFNKTLGDGTLEFSHSDADGIMVAPLDADTFVSGFRQVNGTGSMTGAPPGTTTITSDVNYWQSYFGLLTDRANANVPQSKTIQYSGQVWFKGGDGAPLFAGFLNTTDATCPISLTLDTTFGKLVSGAVNCNDRGTDLNFSLRDLYIKDSRVSGGLGDEATASVSGSAYSAGGGLEDEPPTVTAMFRSNRVGGAVYGSGAKLIVIYGSGPTGLFAISALRQ